ncbi:MAG: hypothetical protein JSW59_05345, partial [Phycisphaerales bacterium]
MKAYKWQSILFWTGVLLFGVLLFSDSARAERAQTSGAEKAIEIARDDPRVKDILADFPEIRMLPSYSERYDVWIIEFLLGDREAGMASVSLEQAAVVEFNFRAEKIDEQPDDEDERAES